ncbi:hypothetical protein [Pseudomonas nitroreducens]|uniref:Uncharacterized protein n=1 Tax=Pseudomonas nitroreducens TaxID=46680 RepID=A0A6G6IY79_PSENT|nr:hypothetical protein [Pseudomonas nitroreducens]QIE88019.1 hypothetical protein G5B91_17750 [Pseudomonas nitroreducens]
MTEQQACTLCGAGGHTAAQCNWNKAIDLVAAIRAAVLTDWKPTTLAATGTKAKVMERIDTFLASQQGEQTAEDRNEAILRKFSVWVNDDEHPEQAEGAQGELHPDLKRVYDVIGLHYSHPVSVLIANFQNTKHFSDLLHAVEHEFFMVPGEPSDEPEDEGCEPDDVCLMSCWGSTQEQYIEQFREALAVIQARAALAQPSPAPELERPEVVAHLRWPTKGSHAEMRFPNMGAIPNDLDRNLYGAESLMTVAQHERILRKAQGGE